MSYKISSLCPVRFHRIGVGDFAYNQIPTFEYSKGYNQIYFHGDRPVIQVLSSGSCDMMQIMFVDINGNQVGGWAEWASDPVENYYGYGVYEFKFSVPPATTIPAGIYFLKLIITDSIGVATFYSEPISVQATTAGTLAIVYDHDENDFDRKFTGPVLPSMIRIEGGMKSDGLQPGGKFTMFQDIDFNSVMLNSQPYNVEKFTFGGSYGIPNHLADKLNRVFGLSDVTIDGVKYSRNEGAKLERSGDADYPLAGWSLDLVKSENPYGETFTTIPIPDVPFTADTTLFTADSGNETADQTLV